MFIFQCVEYAADAESNVEFFRCLITGLNEFVPQLHTLYMCVTLFCFKEWKLDEWPPASLITIGAENEIRVEIMKGDDRLDILNLQAAHN